MRFNGTQKIYLKVYISRLKPLFVAALMISGGKDLQ